MGTTKRVRARALSKKAPRAKKRTQEDAPFVSTTPISKRAKRRTSKEQAAEAEFTRQQEVSRVAKIESKRTARQKKDDDQTLEEGARRPRRNRKKRDVSLDKEAANSDALNKEDVSEETQDITKESPPPTLPEAKTTTTALNLNKEFQTPRGQGSSTRRPPARRLLVLRRRERSQEPRTLRNRLRNRSLSWNR